MESLFDQPLDSKRIRSLVARSLFDQPLDCQRIRSLVAMESLYDQPSDCKRIRALVTIGSPSDLYDRNTSWMRRIDRIVR